MTDNIMTKGKNEEWQTTMTDNIMTKGKNEEWQTT